MKLAWNAIVKNEAARIERCVRSLLPVIDYGIVLDTGSTDDTQKLLVKLFHQAGKYIELRGAPFENFEQARNTALRFARSSRFDWDYLLLADADMELKVQRPFNLNGGLAYDMRQSAGSLSYWNRRLLSRESDALFVGVTHEYLDVASAGTIDNAYFVDHADGANRPDKFARDIALLEAALPAETRPGLIERYHFYLANSYFDAGDFKKAIVHYRKRLELQGYDEERWYAMKRLAECFARLDDPSVFVWKMLQAYGMRPQRTEALYELAKFFRIRGDNATSLLFSQPALQVPKEANDDKLFVDTYANGTGVREEFAICAYYHPRWRSDGAVTADGLALQGSEQAKFNQFWYLQPLPEHVPSFKPQRIEFAALMDYVPMNPSVINHAGIPKILLRTVNYTISDDARYHIRDRAGGGSGPAAIHTRNWLSVLGGGYSEIAMPVTWPEGPPAYDLVLGFEDSRLFGWQGELWTLSTVRELNREGWCESILAPLVLGPLGWRYGESWRQLLPKHRQHEKNWMPWVKGDELRFVYRLGTLVDLQGEVIVDNRPKWDVAHISGGSQVIEIDKRTNLAVVHEARTIPGRPNRYYQHRFVVFDSHDRVDAISAPFFFFDRQIEFCAGLAYFSDDRQVMVSFGVRDCEAWTATMDVDEVIQFTYRDSFDRDCR